MVFAPESINLLTLPSLDLCEKKHLPNCAAIYFVIENSNVIYIGKSATLALRWIGHCKLREFRSRGTPLKIAWLECSDKSLLTAIEVALIKHFQPELNVASKKILIKKTKRIKSKPTKKAKQIKNKLVKHREKTPVKLVPSSKKENARVKKAGNPNPQNKIVSFNPEPLGEVLAMRLPIDLDTYVRSLPNRAEWLRNAIARQMEEDLKNAL